MTADKQNTDNKLEAEQLLPDLIIKYIDGHTVRIGGYHVDLILKMRKMAAWRLMDIFCISDEEMLNAAEDRRKFYIEIALRYMEKKWEFPETGDPYPWYDRNTNEAVFGIHATGNEIKKLMKRGAKKITLLKVAKMIDVFRNNKGIREVSNEE